MKIKTENLKEFKRIFDLTKVAGDIYSNYIYLDFEKEMVIFKNDNTIVNIKLSLEDKDEKQKNLYVEGNKFFFLVLIFEYLELKGNTFYSPLKDKFIIQTLDEEIQLMDGNVDDYEWKEIRLNFTDNFNQNLHIAQEYLDLDMDTSLFFEKGYIVSLSESNYFQGYGDLDEQSSFSLPSSVVRMIQSFTKRSEDYCIVKYRTVEDKGKIYEILFKDLSYTFISSSNDIIPFDPFEESFIEECQYEDYFDLNLKSVLEKVKTLDSYIKNSSSILSNTHSHCEIKFFEENLVFYIKNEGEVEYKQKVDNYSDFENFKGISFWIELDRLKKALTSLSLKKYESVRLKFSSNSIIFSDTEEKDNLFIIQALLLSPNN